ncbi:hypothetical protein ADUPG1_000424, partial [Aduncisulcus paluster]
MRLESAGNKPARSFDVDEEEEEEEKSNDEESKEEKERAIQSWNYSRKLNISCSLEGFESIREEEEDWDYLHKDCAERVDMLKDMMAPRCKKRSLKDVGHDHVSNVRRLLTSCENSGKKDDIVSSKLDSDLVLRTYTSTIGVGGMVAMIQDGDTLFFSKKFTHICPPHSSNAIAASSACVDSSGMISTNLVNESMQRRKYLKPCMSSSTGPTVSTHTSRNASVDARPGSGKEETTPAHSMKIISGADHTEAVEIPTTEISTLNKLITQQQTALDIMSKAILRLTNKVELLEARTYTESKNSLETSSDTASPGKFVKFPIFKTEKEKMSISTHPHEPIFGEKKFISDTETRTQAPAAANPVSDPLDFADPHEQKKLSPPVCGTLPRYPSPLKTHHALASDEFLTEAFASPLT